MEANSKRSQSCRPQLTDERLGECDVASFESPANHSCFLNQPITSHDSHPTVVMSHPLITNCPDKMVPMYSLNNRCTSCSVNWFKPCFLFNKLFFQYGRNILNSMRFTEFQDIIILVLYDTYFVRFQAS